MIVELVAAIAAVCGLILVARWMCRIDPDQERARWQAQREK